MNAGDATEVVQTYWWPATRNASRSVYRYHTTHADVHVHGDGHSPPLEAIETANSPLRHMPVSL